MNVKLKRDWDGLTAIIVFLLSVIGQLYCRVEGMKLTQGVLGILGGLCMIYFVIWSIILRPKRNARMRMAPEQPDTFNESDYLSRTGISGWRIRRPAPWPRPRDQWDVRRNIWDTEE